MAVPPTLILTRRTSMNTYNLSKSLCESFGMSFYETPELSDQELNKIPEDITTSNWCDGFNYSHSEETKRKMSESQKLRQAKYSKEQKQQLGERMSRLHRGKTVTPETKAKMALAKLGKKRGSHSEEHKAKLSKALKGRPGKPFTEEHKAKISKSLKEAKMRKSLISLEL